MVKKNVITIFWKSHDISITIYRQTICRGLTNDHEHPPPCWPVCTYDFVHSSISVLLIFKTYLARLNSFSLRGEIHKIPLTGSVFVWVLNTFYNSFCNLVGRSPSHLPHNHLWLPLMWYSLMVGRHVKSGDISVLFCSSVNGSSFWSKFAQNKRCQVFCIKKR